jgi:hypothetical protein
VLTSSAAQDFDNLDFNPIVVSKEVAGQGGISDIYSEIRRLRT